MCTMLLGPERTEISFPLGGWGDMPLGSTGDSRTAKALLVLEENFSSFLASGSFAFEHVRTDEIFISNSTLAMSSKFGRGVRTVGFHVSNH